MNPRLYRLGKYYHFDKNDSHVFPVLEEFSLEEKNICHDIEMWRNIAFREE